jgi:ribokinase
MHTVFVFGSINIDLVFAIDQLPKQGETIEGTNFFIAPGGKGANQAVACARQGIPTWMIGSVGTDDLSETALSSLSQAGVHTSYISKHPDHHTGVAGILLEDGDNRIILGQGANGVHDTNHIQTILKTEASEGDILLCQLEVPLEDVKTIISYAKTKKMVTILNAAPAKELSPDLLCLIDLLIVNETELHTLTKQTGESKEDYQRQVELLLKHVSAVIVTLGGSGSFYKDHTHEYWCEAVVVNVVDTTAAGDTFIGGYIAAILDNKTIPEALSYASLSSALAIQTLGAQPSIPTKQDVQNYIQKGGTNDV